MPQLLLLQRLQPTTLLTQASTASTTAMPMQMPSPQCFRTIKPLLLLLELQLPLLKAVQSQQPPALPSLRPYTTWDATTALGLHLSVSFHHTQQKPVVVWCFTYALLVSGVRSSAVLVIASSLAHLSQVPQWTCYSEATVDWLGLTKTRDLNRLSQHICISWNRTVYVHR